MPKLTNSVKLQLKQLKALKPKLEELEKALENRKTNALKDWVFESSLKGHTFAITFIGENGKPLPITKELLVSEIMAMRASDIASVGRYFQKRADDETGADRWSSGTPKMNGFSFGELAEYTYTIKLMKERLEVKERIDTVTASLQSFVEDETLDLSSIQEVLK